MPWQVIASVVMLLLAVVFVVNFAKAKKRAQREAMQRQSAEEAQCTQATPKLTELVGFPIVGGENETQALEETRERLSRLLTMAGMTASEAEALLRRISDEKTLNGAIDEPLGRLSSQHVRSGSPSAAYDSAMSQPR